MFSRARGGAALWLALLGISGVLTGCRSQPAPGSKVYVRLDALLSLHPAWAQVQSLAHVSQALAAAPAQAASLRLPASPLPPSFPAPETIPPNLEQERRQRIAEDARHRIAAFAQELRRRNEELLRNEERAARKELDARLTGARIALEAALPARLEQITQEYDNRISPLGYKEVAFRTQVRGFTGSPRTDAEQQLQAVRAEISRLNQERDARLADARAQVQRQLDADKAQWTQQLEARLARRRQQLETLAARRIAREEASLNMAAEPIPPLGSLPSSALAAPPPQPPAPPQPAVAFGQAQAQVSAALQRQIADLAAQRARLITLIRRDTQQAVEQIARQQGWTLVAQGSPKAIDATDAAAVALRAQWQVRQGT